MPERDQDRLEAAERVRRELAIENQLSRAQARTYVRCLTGDLQGADDPVDRARFRASTRLMHAGFCMRRTSSAQ